MEQNSELLSRLSALETTVASHVKDISDLKETLKNVRTTTLLANQSPQAIINQKDEFEALKILLNSDKWPAAVEPFLICNLTSEQDKQDRAEGILDLVIDVHLEKLGFLDFGCGEGHVVNRSLMQNPRISVGYDIQQSERWEQWPQNEKTKYTVDWQEVVKNGPYNVILLYDVIDHIEGDDATVIENLKRIRSVMAPNAKIFVRCHPWCSRHATHLYHSINKAYVHLVFTETELEQLGYKGQICRKIIHPLLQYNDYFKTAGLRFQRKEQVIRADVERFFSETPLVARRIKSHWSSSHDRELREGRRFPPQLDFQFMDIVLF